MKNKTPKNPFDTYCWMHEYITDPYQVLGGLFAEAHVYEFSKLVKKLVHYAAGEPIYKSRLTGDVLLYTKMIRSLIKAANALKSKERNLVVINQEDLFNKKYYCSHYVTADAWREFPRHLSKKEYCNPYLVLKKFFNCQPLTDWLQCWELVIQGAFCNDGVYAPVVPLKVYSYLAKLVEAAHLIDVREVAHVGNCLKDAEAIS
ncbi:hypothetical protein [Niabella aquatica]